MGTPERLVIGKGITDACTNWDDTTEVLRGLAASVAQRRQQLAKSA